MTRTDFRKHLFIPALAVMQSADASACNVVDADRRELFRYLRNATRLRNNPLAARFFAEQSPHIPQYEADDRGLSAVRRAITALAERFREADLQKGLKDQAERCFQAIVRCDVQGEPNKIVASRLGISVRHFRRLRRVAQERIARALRADQEGLRSVSLDVAALKLAIARQRWEGGQCDGALDMLRSIASRAPEARYRVRAMVDLIDLLVHQSKLDAAEKTLDEARGVLSWNDLSRTDKEAYSSWVDFAASRVAFARGNDTTGRNQEKMAISRMAENGAGVDMLARDIFIRALLERAGRNALRGSFDASTADLDQIAQLQAERAPLPAYLLVDHLVIVGEVKIAVSGYDAACETSLKRALAMAQAHGLGGCAVAAAYSLSYIQYLGGRIIEAEDLMRATVDASVDLGMTDLIVEVALDAAEFAFARGDWRQGQLYLDLAGKNANGGTSAIRLEVDQATCLLLAGKPAESLRRAASAELVAAALCNERLRGAALRTTAPAQYALGRRLDAQRTVRQMLSTLESHGSKTSLLLGLRVASQITGSIEFARRAAELAL
jgi:hypothetical protein